MNTLKIFNTLNNKKEVFIPINKNNIKIYACGPTVYNFAHIGNARMAVVFDTFVQHVNISLDVFKKRMESFKKHTNKTYGF